ncbi:P-loop containing nucleoside triphosphate hydrolase protein [Amylocarpus encephaloides]|uniref:P-loop containing nucleoside triphosphate hydrolase protein n=1 Tax=Amylocarpus encephaloides TaxID=45428 RepID=A0A9P7Y7H6_9HELO|nr:P-loop containing nucleoside triphosphate hydrolase protein [Amylocarpus encephaloides]
MEALDVLLLSKQDPNAFNFGILANSPPQGVLLYGPPGTGKTLLVRALANQGHATLLSLTSADIRSRYVGQGEKKIQEIFRYAHKHHPCIIFIDEADALFHSRSAESNTCGHTEDINQFLGEMDGMRSNSASSPMVIAATNRPFDMDEGILRRLGRRVMVDIPDEEARNKIVGDLLNDELVSIDADIPELVRQTHGYSGSDLRALVGQAALTAVREIHHCKMAGVQIPGMTVNMDDGSHEHRRVLRKAHFIRARHEIPASPNKETVAKIRDFHNKFGNTAERFELGDERPEMINVSKGQIHV